MLCVLLTFLGGFRCKIFRCQVSTSTSNLWTTSTVGHVSGWCVQKIVRNVKTGTFLLLQHVLKRYSEGYLLLSRHRCTWFLTGYREKRWGRILSTQKSREPKWKRGEEVCCRMNGEGVMCNKRVWAEMKGKVYKKERKAYKEEEQRVSLEAMWMIEWGREDQENRWRCSKEEE